MRRVICLAGVALVAVFGGGCSASRPSVARAPAPTSTTTADRASWTCPAPVSAALPPWARAGFNNPEGPVPHLAGTRRRIVAVPFGWPLRVHQPAGRDNKILWIAKAPTGPLHIVATEQSSGETATRELRDGPGPSIVDMPKAGCWRLVLSWADQHDELFIRYYGPSSGAEVGHG